MVFGYGVENNRAETLLKTGQTGFLKLFINGTSQSIDKYWASIRICIRNNYKVTKAAVWCNYIDALNFPRKDIHNAKSCVEVGERELQDCRQTTPNQTHNAVQQTGRVWVGHGSFI